MDIKELHDHLYEVLCVIDDICKKENVRYFLDSGTELGAVREHDFIPWDDDMDIVVLSEDYPAFKKAMERNLPPYMHIVEPDRFAPAFYDFTIRIYDERFLLREETEEEQFYKNMSNHVGTDIFVLTKVPESSLAKKYLLLSTKILYGLGMAWRYQIDYHKYDSFLQKCQVAVLSTVGKLISPMKICRLNWKNVHRYENKTAAYRFPGAYPIKFLQFFPENIFFGQAEFPIRDRMFPVPAGFDQHLTQKYGDYMTPPKDTSIYIKHLR